MVSLIVNGMPWSGPIMFPRANSESQSLALSRTSGAIVTTAFKEGLTSSMRFRYFSTRSTVEMALEVIRNATSGRYFDNKSSMALPKNSLSIEASRLMLGARTPSAAQRASARLDSSKELYWQPNSRYALNADEGVRAPSNRRL